ncbi:hypothetical protein VTK56DRAFT_5712 [Thermocarpiscus australiensis]
MRPSMRPSGDAPRPHFRSPISSRPFLARMLPVKRGLGHILTDSSEAQSNKRRETLTTMAKFMTASAAAGSLLEDPIDYTHLKAWIAQQEANPRPLTPQQRRAISDLILSLRSEEPNLGDRDWISLLFQYCNAHRINVDAVSFNYEPALNGKWACRCAFDHPTSHKIFPSLDFGYVPNADGVKALPSFSRKKDAKQYAAKCCVEWLMAVGRMPSDGVNVVFPRAKAKPPSPLPPSPGPLTATNNNPGTTTSASLRPTLTPTPTGNEATTTPQPKQTTTTPPQSGSPIDIHDDDIPATRRVAELCRRLGIVVPRYEVTPSSSSSAAPTTTTGSSGTTTMATTTDFFDGRADFGVDSARVPEGLGRVVGVYTRRAARERIAEEVLGWLVQEERRREGDVRTLLGGGGGGC